MSIVGCRVFLVVFGVHLIIQDVFNYLAITTVMVGGVDDDDDEAKTNSRRIQNETKRKN